MENRGLNYHLYSVRQPPKSWLYKQPQWEYIITMCTNLCMFLTLQYDLDVSFIWAIFCGKKSVEMWWSSIGTGVNLQVAVCWRSISWFSESWPRAMKASLWRFWGSRLGFSVSTWGPIRVKSQSLRHGGFHSKSSPAEPLHGKSTLKNATPRAVPNVVELGHQHRQEQTSMRCGRVLALTQQTLQWQISSQLFWQTPHRRGEN